MNIFSPLVKIGKNTIIEDGVEIGKPKKGKKVQSRPTVIGDNCLVRRGTIIFEDVVIGDNFQSGYYTLIREENIIGNNVSIGSRTELGPGNCIGDYSRIHSGCFLEMVIIGHHVFIAPMVMFTNDPHPTCRDNLKCCKGAIVEDYAIIGGNATLLPHIRIGKSALIGAGSVVTKDVPKETVVAGNPARRLKKISNIVCRRNDHPHKPYGTKKI